MKKFNHKAIIGAICEKYNLNSYNVPKYKNITYLKGQFGDDVGFIEQIPSNGKYLYTVLVSMFDFDKGEKVSAEMEDFVLSKYREQYIGMDRNVLVAMQTSNKDVLI